MDPGAIERLADKMQRSHAQEASITKNLAEPNIELRERDLGQVLQEEQERQQDSDRDNDLGFGID